MLRGRTVRSPQLVRLIALVALLAASQCEARGSYIILPHTLVYNNNNNNGFRVRFGVRGRHRGPPFALGYHRFIIIVAIQGEGGGEGGTQAGSVIPCICPG